MLLSVCRRFCLIDSSDLRSGELVMGLALEAKGEDMYNNELQQPLRV